MTVRARLRFLADCIPASRPLATWQAYWDFADSRRAASHQGPVPRPTGHNPDRQAYARVDDGRWIADCPWGCRAAFNLPRDAEVFWCTECAGGGWGLTAALVWPDGMGRLTANLESLPSMLQAWPCDSCVRRAPDAKRLCDGCRAIAGEEV